MHFMSYHAWKHPIFNWQPAYTTCHLNISITALTALRAKCKDLAVIRGLINLYRLLLNPIYYQVLFKKSLSLVTSKSRQFSAIRRIELKDTLRVIIDLVEQRTNSKIVYLINIGQEYSLLVLIKYFITARLLYLALNTVNIIIDIFKQHIIQAVY